MACARRTTASRSALLGYRVRETCANGCRLDAQRKLVDSIELASCKTLAISQDTYRAAAARRRRRPGFGFGFGRSSPATLIFAFRRSLRVPEPGSPWPFFPDGRSSAFLNTKDTLAPWFVVASSGASTACW